MTFSELIISLPTVAATVVQWYAAELAVVEQAVAVVAHLVGTIPDVVYTKEVFH